MDRRACMSKQVLWNKFPFNGDRQRESFSRGLTSPDSMSEKITQAEQSPLIRRHVYGRNYTEQIPEKINTVKICTHVLRKGNTSRTWKSL